MPRAIVPYSLCPECGKRGYYSKVLAKKARRNLRDGHMGIYRCRYREDLWHVGHLPTQVITGKIARDDIFLPNRI